MSHSPPPQRQHHLIDVRTPTEFSTGHLTSDLCPTLNIEYQSIAQLAPIIHAARGIHVQKTDDITLYCRSGRRSGIALKTLRDMGFEQVRDIGGLEDARRVLDREVVGRQLDEEMEGGNGVDTGKEKEEDTHGRKGDARVKGFGRLVEGLRELEG
ncbi:hypothetical protein T440DRAFT_232963 [Plenodomus tracheiphilus IPT5]|uniref:Rhodanese domain-containing protein n=1 Tax=Plenodomus tracheiphilus IPT5 TaxID=1408161 RepID=A0A6A7ASP1_9PLEO|nr:hypothetical protein T440DRAFT_232963 [Plenodomus tracheiphilus IPT5]